MECVTFEDDSAIYEATFFPDTYRRVWNKLLPNCPFDLSGMVEEDFGAVTLNVEDIARLDVAEKRCYGDAYGGEGCEEGEALGCGFPAPQAG